MRRRIAAVGPLASESSSHRGPFLEDFRNLTATVAKYSLVRARQNPCAAGTGTVFSQTLTNLVIQNLPRSLQRGINMRADVLAPNAVEKTRFIHHEQRLRVRAAEDEMFAA